MASSSEIEDSISAFKMTARNQPLKQLNRIAKKPPVNIEFQDLTYSVPDSTCKSGKLIYP